MKINTEKWFIPLKKAVPFLYYIENKEALVNLINLAAAGSGKQTREYIEDMLSRENNITRKLLVH
jgi:mannitol/fructose-specific phosphotransferase system IIA component